MFFGKKNLFYVQTAYFDLLNNRFNHKMVLYKVNLIISTQNTSKFFLSTKAIPVHNKANVIWSITFFSFWLKSRLNYFSFVKLCKTMIRAKLFCSFFPKFIGLVFLQVILCLLRPRSTSHVFDSNACKNGHKNIVFYKIIRIEPNMNQKSY